MKATIFRAIMLCIILLSAALYAEVADYTFVQSTGNYVEITGGLSLGTETSDDQRYVDPTLPTGGTTTTGPGLPIGFNFTFNDYVFDVIAINTNGWISFGQSSLGTTAVNNSSTSAYTPLGSTATITPVQLYNRIAGFARDLQAQVGASLRMETIGTAPNRICIIQWKNYKRYSTTGTGDILNFQIQLHETLNKVSIIYGNCVAGTTTSSTIQVGLRGDVATDFNNRNSTTDWTLTAAGTTNTASITFVQGIVPPANLLFEFMPPIAATNDLQAMSISGTTTPSVGMASNYTVAVRNRGSAQQTTYQVKLMSGTTELATVAGPTIAPSQVLDVIIPWTPTTQGAMTIYGKVVLAGDENPLNNDSPPMNITVFPAGTLMVTIGTGTSAQVYPLYSTYGYSRDASIYTAAEVGNPGLITGIQYDVATQNGNTIPYRVLMKTTTATQLVAQPWATTIADAQLCGEGSVTVNQLGWVYIPFTTPFFYDGNNLVVMVENNYGGTGSTASQTFRYTASTTASHHYMYAENTPPTTNGYVNANRPNIGISFQMGGMGALNGLVTSGGLPVEGALITIQTTTLTQLTNTAGTYNFPFVQPGTYQVTCSKLGFETQTQQAVITVGGTTTLNFSLTASASVNVFGTVVGSDAPTVGLANAAIALSGVLNYNGTTNASGQFSIPGVLSGNTYNYTISKAGYQNNTGTITVGASNYNMGTVVLNEIAIPPGNVQAAVNANQTAVNLIWRAPGTPGTSNVDDFELNDGGWVPTSNWTNPLGDWQWNNTYNVANYDPSGSTSTQQPPQAAHSGTGLWGTVVLGPYSNSGGWSYLRKTFNFSGISDPVINFWHHMDGFNTWDYGLIVVNGTTVWGTSGAAVFMPWQNLNIPLTQFANMSNVQIGFEWYATTVVNYAGWYIDDVYVGSASGAPTYRAEAPSITQFNNSNRALLGYKVWRLMQGQETNEAVWTSLTANVITDTTLTDTGFATWPDGTYKWAVKSVYTGNVMSTPGFSNTILKRPNDLAALSISGSLSPSVGSASNYTINIRNAGSSPQTAGSYTVKVMSGTTELASVSGPAIQPNQTLDVIVPWTPTTQGTMVIYGKVVLATDTMPDNDNTPNLNIYVHPAGTIVVTVGDGSQMANTMPVNMFYKASMYQNIYYSDEMTAGGVMTSMAFYNNFLTNLPNKPTKIWLGVTNQQDLSAGWISSNDMTLVFDGNVDYPSGENTILIPFTTPFPYAGGNLAMLVQRPLDTQYFSSSDRFYTQTVGTNRARNINSDTVVYDPANMTGGTLSGQFPKTTFFFTAAGNDPVFAISPQSFNFGQKLINTTTNKSFNIMNVGGGTTPLIINNISITGSPFFTLQNLPTLPVSLTTGQTTTFVVQYAPTTAGEHTATVTVTDNMARTYTYSVSRDRDGGTRTDHPVPVSGTAIDVTIYALPYAQNFDAVTVPNLPLDWNTLIVQTTGGYIRTVTTTPQSTPNCVSIYNGTNAAAQLLLIAPPLANTIPINASRIRFWLKAGGTGYTCQIGVIADITDPATFTEIATVTPTTAWTEQVVGFQTYAGTGRYIAIKHGMGGTGRTLYVDDVMLEVIADNDLAAVSLTGNQSPSVGNPTPYTVSITNWGTLPQSNYQVKLFNSNNVELATAPGPAIDPGLTVNAIVNWTPTTQGAMSIYGKVVLTGDQNNLNDQTTPMNIYVHPAGTMMVTIGTGTTAQVYPLYSTYGYSRDASIYTAAELGVPGLITGIQYDVATQTGNTIPYRVLMKNTTETALVAQPWATTIADAQLCAEGSITINQLGWAYIPFTIPFVYAGQNLVVMVENNYGGAGTSTSQTFRYTASTTASHHYNYADTTPPATNGYVNANRPNIGISFTAMGTEPAFAVSPTSHNYGQTFMNVAYDKSFTIVNIGGGTTPLIINNISIGGSPHFSLQNLPTLPVSLASFQTANFIARYLPTAVGEHSATITITDNLARTYTYGVSRENRDGLLRVDHPVPLTATCIDPTIYTSPYTQNFDTVTIPNLPIDWSKFIVSPGNVTTVTTTPNSTPNCVLIQNSTSTNGPYLISPPISTTLPLNTMRMRFWARAAAANYQLAVGAMTNPTDAATYTQVTSMALTTTWTEYVVGFQTYTGTGQFMAIKHGNASTSQSIYVDNVMIEVIPENDLAALSVTGNTTPSVGMPTNYSVNLFNWGTLPQSNYTVKLFKQGDIELASVPGPTIQPGMAAVATVPWVPATQEQTFIYGKVVLTGDQNPLNDQTPNLNVSVYPAGTMVITVGDGSQLVNTMPVYMYYKSSLYENIYFNNEMNFIGMITGIAFYNNFVTNLPGKPTKVWLGTTTQTDLSTGWIHSTNMTLVYDGPVDYPSGENTVTITLQTPFLYLQDNLVMMVNRPLDTAYYNSNDRFYVQTVGTNRARRINSDTVEYDPTTITGGTLTGQFPKTSFLGIPGFVGHLTGTVLGAGNQPLSNATIQLQNGMQTTTNAQGQYTINNIINGTYDVTASRHGYIPQTVTVVIPEDSTVVQNFTLMQLPTVNVTGTIVGSDAPTVGIPNAVIVLSGYEDYQATTNAQGVFTISGVYTNQTYQYQASAVGYQNATGTVPVGTTNHNMGTITVSEIAYTPRNVTATQAANQFSVTVNWVAPDPNAVDITESFEAETFPPVDWTRIVTNNGPANTLGVFPTWCRFGTVTSGTTTVIPQDGSWQAGFWWDYNHQDEWLISPQFNCPQGANLTFWTYCYRGSLNNDHYYVKVSNNNGNSWTVLWDASALTGGWNNYQTPVVIDLADYAGQQIKLAWHADDPNSTSDGMWYNWFIDNVVIGNSRETIRFSELDMQVKTASDKELKPLATTNAYLPMSRDERSNNELEDLLRNTSVNNDRNNRALLGYKVWRLVQGQETNEATWTALTPDMITELTLVDNGWATVPAGTYKWAVKGVYTNNVMSLGAFSNPIVKNPMPSGTLTGYVRNVSNLPIIGATVTAGAFSATTAANGTYSMTIPVGTYAVTASAPGYSSLTHENIIITQGQTTVSNFILPVSNDDMVEVAQTVLKGNYPNPFNPETIITFDIKERVPVRVEIFNTKGQLIRTLVNSTYDRGQHQVIWNGKDDNGISVASGIYNYRMTAGEYKANRRMMLLK